MLLSRLTLTICQADIDQLWDRHSQAHVGDSGNDSTDTFANTSGILDFSFSWAFFLRMIYNLQVLKRFFNVRRTAFVINTLNSTCLDLIAFEWWYFGAASSPPTPSRTSCPSTWDYLGNGPRSTYQKSKLIRFCVRVYVSKAPWGKQYFYAAKVPIPYSQEFKHEGTL